MAMASEAEDLTGEVSSHQIEHDQNEPDVKEITP
jgi:hypothetical protein